MDGDRMKLKGKVALLTAAAGAAVVVTDANGQRSVAVAERLAREFGVEAMGLECDVTRREHVEEVVRRTADRFDRIDILVNNAGTNRPSKVIDLSDEAWELVLNTSLRGTFYLCRAVLPIMTRQRFGRIVNIASAAAFMGLKAGHAHYAAAKAGVMAFTRCLAMEAAEDFVTVNAVAPGFISNEFIPRIYPEGEIARMEESIPYARKGTPEDVARTVLFLATDGEYITGQTICVTGGSWMH
jgi:NAD(P)-dependent dehydrogenase (short-subunit alcohol dehydrogenase family)